MAADGELWLIWPHAHGHHGMQAHTHLVLAGSVLEVLGSLLLQVAVVTNVSVV
jgi:hypothetical protein